MQRGASYIPTPNWIKNKKATINPKNNDIYYFIYAITIALYHKELGTNPERISKKLIDHIKLLNWYDEICPASLNDYIIFEQLNEDIALNTFYVPYNQKTICTEYISNRNFTAKKQVALLKITDNNDKWHFLALPSIPTDNGYLRPIKS